VKCAICIILLIADGNKGLFDKKKKHLKLMIPLYMKWTWLYYSSAF